MLDLGKGSYPQHIDKLIDIFASMCLTGLKVNYTICSFGLLDIPYLGYNITWEWIKPYPK